MSMEDLDAKMKSDIKRFVASLYADGGDTTVSFPRMQPYPKVQLKAHREEIDRVIGKGGFPVIVVNRPNLPYIEVASKELLRRNTVAPLITYLTSSSTELAERSPLQAST